MSTLSSLSARLRVAILAILVLALLFVLGSSNIASVSAQTLPPRSSGISSLQDIKLVSFTAEAKGSKVLLKWETVNELSIIGFYVWRRTKTGDWIRLDNNMLVAAHPGESAGNLYGVKDKGVSKNRTYFYLLEVLNADGTSSFSDEVKVKLKSN